MLEPKGDGALQLNDDGDDRGVNAVDLQMIRSSDEQVSSGDYSATIGIYNTNNVIVGMNYGYGNVLIKEEVLAKDCTIQSVQDSGNSSVILGGVRNLTFERLLSSGAKNTAEQSDVKSMSIDPWLAMVDPQGVQVTPGSTVGLTTPMGMNTTGGGLFNNTIGLLNFNMGGAANTVGMTIADDVVSADLFDVLANNIPGGMYNAVIVANPTIMDTVVPIDVEGHTILGNAIDNGINNRIGLITDTILDKTINEIYYRINSSAGYNNRITLDIIDAVPPLQTDAGVQALDTIDVTGNSCYGYENKITARAADLVVGTTSAVIRYNAILSGHQNIITRTSPGTIENNIICGGDSNSINGALSYIGGGLSNSITGTGSGIMSGLHHDIKADYSVILGGDGNIIATTDPNSAQVLVDRGFIGSGSNNKVYVPYGVIVCGTNNEMYHDNQNTSVVNNASYIGGGSHNIIYGNRCVINGGSYNRIARGADGDPTPDRVVSHGTILGGQGLIVDQDYMTSVGTYNAGDNDQKPVPVDPYGKIFRIDSDTGSGAPSDDSLVSWHEDLRSALDSSAVLFSVGSGTGDSDRKDAFLVNDKGIAWTRNYFTCSFGSDVAELYELEKSVQEIPPLGTLMVVQRNGRVVPYDHSVHHSHGDRILGIVSDSAMLLGNGDSLFKYKRDPETAAIIYDVDGKPVIRDNYKEMRRVAVGICGRVLLHKKYVDYLPDRWIVYDELEYGENFVLVQIR